MIIIGIETSCDETAIGIVKDGKEILANVVSTQIEEHKKYAGVVPEIASRLHLQKINFVYAEALKQAGISPDKIDLISVNNQPGLVGSLMVGASFAKTLSMDLNKPLLTVNHLIAHLYANFLKGEKPGFPYIGLVISGGHTLLLIAESHHDYKIVGTTLDDAVGESYDKIAKLLGLDYPGGPLIDKICREYEGDYIEFTSGLKNDKKNKYNFSYSGLKTAVFYYYKKNPNTELNKILKGFQIAAIKILVEKTASLCEATGIKEVVIGGGVAANSYLRDLFLNKKDLKVHLPDISLCMDNGAMTACAAYYRSRSGQFDPLDFDVYSKPKGGPAAYLKKRSVHFSV